MFQLKSFAQHWAVLQACRQCSVRQDFSPMLQATVSNLWKRSFRFPEGIQTQIDMVSFTSILLQFSWFLEENKRFPDLAKWIVRTGPVPATPLWIWCISSIFDLFEISVATIIQEHPGMSMVSKILRSTLIENPTDSMRFVSGEVQPPTSLGRTKTHASWEMMPHIKVEPSLAFRTEMKTLGIQDTRWWQCHSKQGRRWMAPNDPIHAINIS